MNKERFDKMKDNVIDTLIGVIAVGVLMTAVNLYLDVDRLKASEHDLQTDIKEIKKDVNDVRNYLLGAKK
jgi:Mn2+/Fe2+ NRAMP family transporter